MLSPERIREIALDCEDPTVITSSTNAEDLRALADEIEMNQRMPAQADRRLPEIPPCADRW